MGSRRPRWPGSSPVPVPGRGRQDSAGLPVMVEPIDFQWLVGPESRGTGDPPYMWNQFSPSWEGGCTSFVPNFSFQLFRSVAFLGRGGGGGRRSWVIKAACGSLFMEPCFALFLPPDLSRDEAIEILKKCIEEVSDPLGPRRLAPGCLFPPLRPPSQLFLPEGEINSEQPDVKPATGKPTFFPSS